MSRCVQDQYEKAMAALQERTEDLETKLKGVRMVLQEQVQQHKDQVSLQAGPGLAGGRVCEPVCDHSKLCCRLQLAKNNKSSLLLKDLYVENSQLMKALQVTEQRQKHAEKKNFLLEEKVNALNKLLREIVPAALAT